MSGLQIQRAMRAVRQAGATDVTLRNRDKPFQKRRQSQDKTHPEEALGGIEDLHGNAERGVLGGAQPCTPLVVCMTNALSIVGRLTTTAFFTGFWPTALRVSTPRRRGASSVS